MNWEGIVLEENQCLKVMKLCQEASFISRLRITLRSLCTHKLPLPFS